jgi:hypothetical protein
MSLLPLGLHFGLPEDLYHADPGLGSTDLKAISLEAVDWQFDRLHDPDRDKDTPAKVWGSALHARVLEGRAAFADKFRVAPAKEDYDDLLVTSDDIKTRLKEFGVYVPSKANKPQLAAMVLEADSGAQVWDVILQKFEEECGETVTVIKPETLKAIELAVEWMARHPKISGVMADGAFFGGAPELSFIYERDGVRLKARFDYAYPGLILDLKSYAPWRPKATKLSILRAIQDYRYDLQSAAYRMAFEEARRLWADNLLVIHGAPPTADFLGRLFEPDEIKWIWLMVKKVSAPTSTLVEFRDDLLVASAARLEIDNAIDTYREMRARFGADADWAPAPDVVDLVDEDFPSGFGVFR